MIIFSDYKYWDDASDEYRFPEGSLLPLWKFSCKEAELRNTALAVTSVCWKPKHADLFAVGYCSGTLVNYLTETLCLNYTHYRYFNLLLPDSSWVTEPYGMLCLYKLNSVEVPEYCLDVEGGIMCLDFHPKVRKDYAKNVFSLKFSFNTRQSKDLQSCRVISDEHFII